MHSTIDLIFFELPLYTTLVMLGIIAGLGAAHIFLQTRSRRAASLPVFFSGALVILMAGWLGARTYHVAMDWDYYSTRPEEIAQVGLGGLAIRGALIAGALALFIYARWRGLHFARLADAAAMGLCLGQAIGWGGALASGANYGVVSDSPMAMDLPDIYGLEAPRFPLQYVEIGFFLCLLIGLILLALRQPKAGLLFVIYLCVASLGNFVLGFQRGDETVMFAGLRVDQWVDVGLSVTALLFYSLVYRGGNVGINK